jgi:ribosomal protein S18 acetylase RimI-like enzyme
MEDIRISCDKKKLDLDFINGFISTSYWGKGRTAATMQTCIDNSLNFGIYNNGQQIGYGRVVTDYVVFAYILDVFIDEDFRGQGFGKLLMNYIMDCEELSKVKVWRLNTTDAHELYKRSGFRIISKPENFMERVREDLS